MAESLPHPPLIIVSGPSGVGKSSVLVRLLDIYRFPMRQSVSATTRLPRNGEIDGREYHFWSKERFEREIAAESFLEYALVHQSNYYGTPRSEVEPFLAGGTGVVMDIDVQGAAQVRKRLPQALSVFLLAPDYESRLRARKTEDEAGIQKRLRSAELELSRSTEYDILLTNRDLEETVRELKRRIEQRFGLPQER